MTWFDQFARDNFDALVPNMALNALQIGVWTGDATAWLLGNRNVTSLLDVDCWDGPPMHNVDYAEAERVYDQRFAHCSEVVKVKAFSDDFFATNDRTFNFIYVDGDHDPEQTYRDGVNAWNCLEPGGTLAFDDYEWQLYGVSPKSGIDRALAEMSGHELLLMAYQVWVKKP